MASFEKIIAGKNQIDQYIPQKKPMVMIDELVSAADKKTITTLTIRKDNIFFQNNHFQESGMIENMAQTAAAGVGYRSKMEQKPPPVGFIGGIRNLRISKLPEEGQTILTEITIEHEVFEATVVNGKIFLDEDLIAEGELKIFLQKTI